MITLLLNIVEGKDRAGTGQDLLFQFFFDYNDTISGGKKQLEERGISSFFLTRIVSFSGPVLRVATGWTAGGSRLEKKGPGGAGRRDPSW